MLQIQKLELLLLNVIKVYNHKHLHAKIYSFDNKKVIVTSANLTYNGPNKNYEQGILVDGSNIKDDLQCLIDDDLSGIFNQDSIDYKKNKLVFIKIKNIKLQQIIQDMKFLNVMKNQKILVCNHDKKMLKIFFRKKYQRK